MELRFNCFFFFSRIEGLRGRAPEPAGPFPWTVQGLGKILLERSVRSLICSETSLGAWSVPSEEALGSHHHSVGLGNRAEPPEFRALVPDMISQSDCAQGPLLAPLSPPLCLWTP